MFVLGDLLDSFHILELKSGLTKTSQEASYKLIPNEDAPGRLSFHPGAWSGTLSADWVGSLLKRKERDYGLRLISGGSLV